MLPLPHSFLSRCGKTFHKPHYLVLIVKAGTTLQQLSSTMDPITVETVLLLVVFALLSLAPVLLKNKLKTKFE